MSTPNQRPPLSDDSSSGSTAGGLNASMPQHPEMVSPVTSDTLPITPVPETLRTTPVTTRQGDIPSQSMTDDPHGMPPGQDNPSIAGSNPAMQGGANTSMPETTYPPPDLTSQTGVPVGNDYVPPQSDPNQLQSQYHDLQSQNPSLAQSMMDSTNTVNNTLQGMSGQTTSHCQTCADQVASVISPIISKITKYITDADKCSCNCKQSLATQLAGVTATVSETTSRYPSPYPANAKPNITPTITPTTQQYPHPPVSYSTPPPYPYKPNSPVKPPKLVTVKIPQLSYHVPTKAKHKWHVWCNKNVVDSLILIDKESPPNDIDWVHVGDAGSLVAAQQLAADSCPYIPKKKSPPSIGPPSSFGVHTITCDITNFTNTEKLTDFLDPSQQEALQAHLYSIVHGAAKSAFEGIDKLPLVGAMVGAVKATLWGPLYVRNNVAPVLSQLLGCSDPLFVAAISKLSMLGYFEEQLGFELSEHKLPFVYAANVRCRSKHLEPNEAMAAFLADEITYSACDVYWAMNGYCPEDVRLAARAQRAKLIPEQLVDARYREIIGQYEYEKGMRELGYTEEKDVNIIKKLWTEIPGPAELVRFMVRDADDKDIVDSLGLDDLFEHKYGDRIQEWAKHQGLTDEQMLYNWRSHWTIPEPQQLFEFWQRLRRNGQFGTPEEQRRKIEQALIHNDILPTWFDSYFAVQYNPLGRRDLSRAYNLGIIDEQRINDGFAAIGFSDDDAESLTKFSHKYKIENAQNLHPVKLWLKFAIDESDLNSKLSDFGFSQDDIDQIKLDAEFGFEHSHIIKQFLAGQLPFQDTLNRLVKHGVSAVFISYVSGTLADDVKTTPALKDYEIGKISKFDCEQKLIHYGVGVNRIEVLINAIDDKLKASQFAFCTSSVRKQYLTGGINTQDAVNTLGQLGMSPERVELLAHSWDCQLKSIDKAVPIAKLCEWLARGAIDHMQFINRLQALGYSNNDSYNILADCQDKINIGLAKDAAKRAKEVAKQMADQAKANAKTQADIDKRKKAIETLHASQARAKINRESQLYAVASNVQSKCNCNVGEAMAMVNEAKAILQGEYKLTIDESLACLTKASGKWAGPPKSPGVTVAKGGGVGSFKSSPAQAITFIDLVRAEAELIVSSRLPVDVVSLVGGLTVNGSTHPS